MPYSTGMWVDEAGELVEDLGESFRAIYNNRIIIVTFIPVKEGGGHGEGTWTASVPMFMYEDTLEVIKSDPCRFSRIGGDEFIELITPKTLEKLKAGFLKGAQDKIGGFDFVSDDVCSGIATGLDGAWDYLTEKLLAKPDGT